jgi:hypothetical protein
MHKENMITGAFNERAFERRVPDALRNAKNYGIIMNTLLRKAAEHGGVHPIYIDRISSEFARKIENMPALAENSALMAEMFRTYCRLVRKHSMKNYSPPVQKKTHSLRMRKWVRSRNTYPTFCPRIPNLRAHAKRRFSSAERRVPPQSFTAIFFPTVRSQTAIPSRRRI